MYNLDVGPTAAMKIAIQQVNEGAMIDRFVEMVVEARREVRKQEETNERA